MPTTHTWNPNNYGYLFDAANYTDGTSFVDGDTLVVNGGTPGAQGRPGSLGTLATGIFQFNAGSASESLQLGNIALPGGATIATVGQANLAWSNFGQFVNDGTVQVGSPAAAGGVDYTMNDATTPGDASFTNNGTVLLQNGSVFRINTDNTGNGTFLNAAGGVLSVNSNSNFYESNSSGVPNSTFVNNGLVAVNGAAGQTTDFRLATNYKGTGLLSVRGAPGAAANTTYADIQGPSNGTFDVASGEVQFEANPLGGSVNFLDGNGLLSINGGTGFANVNPFNATIAGFQAGDSIFLQGLPSGITTYNYDSPSHVLSLRTSSGSAVAQLTIQGTYTVDDFNVSSPDGGASGWTVTTTSTANAAPAFSYKDTVTNALGSDAGVQYTDGVAYLQSQYIWSGQDSVNIDAHMPNVFLKGGAGNDALAAMSGSNVLDGNLGSNFLVGASGADGGRDTFFLDGRQTAPTWDTLVNFHPGDGVTLYGYTPGQSVMAWADNDGTPGYTGATIHAAFAGAGTDVNGSVTFAGISLADAQSKFSVSPGSFANGLNYLYVHYNG